MKTKIFFIISILSLFFVSTVFGTLLTISDDIVYDDVSNQYWQRDLGKIAENATGSTGGAMHWYDVSSTLDDLNNTFLSPSWTDWRLASLGDIDSLLANSLSAISAAFLPNYNWFDPRYENNNVFFGMIDSGQADLKDALFISWFHYDDGYSVYDTYGTSWFDEYHPSFGASGWFVADAVPVPEPAAAMLFCMGVFFCFVKEKTANNNISGVNV